MEFERVAYQIGDWGPKLRPFIESKEFDNIFAFIKQESRDGKIICPQHKDIFRAFRETAYSDLRAIFMLQDPYPWIKGDQYVADGIPMSCSYTNKCQPSLDLFYDGMEDDLGVKVPHMPDLSYLCKEGVLFLNTSLTVELNKPGSHTKIGLWDPFIEYLITEVINFYNPGLVYVGLGANAKTFTRAVIPFIHWGFEVEHPAAAAHKNRQWNHQNVFTKINKIVKDCNNEQINWVYEPESKILDSNVKTAIRGKIRK